jgi:hypothetical protein
MGGPPPTSRYTHCYLPGHCSCCLDLELLESLRSHKPNVKQQNRHDLTLAQQAKTIQHALRYA